MAAETIGGVGMSVQPKLHSAWSWPLVVFFAIVCLLGWFVTVFLPFPWWLASALLWLFFSVVTLTAARRLRERDRLSRQQPSSDPQPETEHAGR
jgi:membrane protein implicated in regulation of membrane protease activity